MSLNRSEQRIDDYLGSHPEERHHWEAKVRSIAARLPDRTEAATRLDADLWAYCVERSAVAEPFRTAARLEGLRRISMRNLAELLLRRWAPPPPRSPAAGGGPGGRNPHS